MEGILGWVKGIIGWLLIMSLVLQCVPGKVYRSYLRLFIGIILILTVLEPLSNRGGIADEFEKYFGELAYDEAVPGWQDNPMKGHEWEEKLHSGEGWTENRIMSLAEEMSKEESSQYEDGMNVEVESVEVEEAYIGVSGGE